MSGGDILREVDEALRVEKATKFWKDHGKTLMVLIIAVVLGTAVQSGWSAYQKHQAEISTSKFLDATKDSDSLSALKKLSAEKNSSGSVLAGLTAAAQLETKQDWQGAMDQYANVIANKKSAWYPRAVLLSAVIKADMMKDIKAAQADLQILTALPDLPTSFMDQIKSLNDVYALREANQK